MKKFVSFCLAVVIAITTVSCGNSSVKITVPSELYTEEVTDEIAQGVVDESGYNSYVINDDGSVTYTLDKEVQDEILSQFITELDITIESITNGSEKVEGFEKIEYNEDLTEFKIYVDSSLFSVGNAMYSLVFYSLGATYQMYSGLTEDVIDVKVIFIDKDTNAIIQEKSMSDF